MSSGSHDYERLHGTQSEQAKRQSTTIPVVGGPFHLVRHIDGLGKVVMTNSVRTTRKEADDLVVSECTRTGIFWSVEDAEYDQAPVIPDYCPACLRPIDNDGRITVRLSPDEIARLGKLLASETPSGKIIVEHAP